MKKLTIDDLTRLNTLLDDSLQQASKEQLSICIKLLGTSLAQLKIKYQVNEDLTARNFYDFVKELEESKLSEIFKGEIIIANDLMSFEIDSKGEITKIDNY